jgi:carbamoyltransferase
MHTLGLSAFAPDAAAVLLRDVEPVAAAREELFTGVRGESSFPRRAARYCLREAGLAAEGLDAVAFFAKPLRKFERELTSHLHEFPASAGAFSAAMFRWLGDRLWMRNAIVAELGVEPGKVLFAEHQQAHAASAFLTSPFEEAAVLTTATDGEWATVALARGRGASVEVQRELHHPHDLARLVDVVAHLLALDPVLDESRRMALAGHGAPRLLEALRSLVSSRPDGSFELSERIARAPDARARRELAALLGTPRSAEEPLAASGANGRHADLACSLRELLAELQLALLRALHDLVPSRNLCLGGLLARDPGLNARLIAEGPFERVHVDAAAGNAAAARGAALLVAAERGGRAGAAVDWLRLGPQAAEGAAGAARELESDEALAAEVAQRLAAGELAGWMQGRASLCGRSQGGRAILADARSFAAAERIRSGVKRREPFVPFGMAVAAERLDELFEATPRARAAVGQGSVVARPRERLRETLGPVVHADGSVRLACIDRGRDPRLHALLARFGRTAGLPVLLHTTLRLHGEPMARGQSEGLRLLGRSRLDFLIVERRLYEPR